MQCPSVLKSLHILCNVIFSLPPPLFNTLTHSDFEAALLQCTDMHSNQSILQLIYGFLCSMLNRLGHEQTRSGGISSLQHVGEVVENYLLFIVNITKAKEAEERDEAGGQIKPIGLIFCLNKKE